MHLDRPSTTGFAAGPGPSQGDALIQKGRGKPALSAIFNSWRDLRRAVLFQELGEAFPTVLGGCLAITRPVIGIESMRRVRVNHDLDLVVTGGLHLGFHIPDGFHRNAAILAAKQGEDRSLDLAGHVDRVGWCVRVLAARNDPAILGDARLHIGIVGGIHPNHPAAPAETGDGKLAGIAVVAAGEFHGRIQIGHDLLVRHFRDDFADQLADLLEVVFRSVALAVIHLQRDGEVPLLGNAAATVLDVLVYPDNFLDDQDLRMVGAGGRHRHIGGDAAVGRWCFDDTATQPVHRGFDHRGICRADGQGKNRRHGCAGNEHAAHNLGFRRQADQFRIFERIGWCVVEWQDYLPA